jgi:hypothetical protein
VRAALKPAAPRPRATALGRFFSVYSDSRAWTAIFYMLLSLVTGIFYFTVATVGVSLSLGLAITVVGILFFLLFIGFTRVLSLTEGRLVEGLLGVRMPRRPVRSTAGTPFGTRIKEMLTDPRTWSTLLYMFLMLPLGIFYFTLAIVMLAVSFALIIVPFADLLRVLGVDTGGVQFGGWFLPWPLTLPIGAFGVLLLTAFLHAARGLGAAHGTLARALLLSRDPE